MPSAVYLISVKGLGMTYSPRSGRKRGQEKWDETRPKRRALAYVGHQRALDSKEGYALSR